MKSKIYNVKGVDKDLIMFGLGCITVLEAIALFMGINGVLLRTVIIIIAMGIGITMPQLKIK